MTTIRQIAQSYQHMLAVANGQRQMQVTNPPQGVAYQPYSGRNLQDFITYNSQMFTNLEGAYVRGGVTVTPTDASVALMVNGMTGGSYTNANDAKADFRLLQQAAARPSFNGNVELYMNAVITAAQNPTTANMPFTLDSLDSARVFSGAQNTGAVALGAANTGGTAIQAANVTTPAPVVIAVTAFLTGDATPAKITALKGAVNVTDSTPAGQLHGRGGANGADALVATRTALDGPLTATNHPELYALARARYYEMTGLPADRAATPTEITASQTRIQAMNSAQIAEYQSVAYLLERNETALTNGKINIDGIYGDRTAASIETVGKNLLPAAPAAGVSTIGADATTSTDATVAARPRVVVLDMSIEDSRGDRERLLRDVPAELQRQLNTDPARPVTVAVFNPRDHRDGPQTLTQFMQTQGANADVVGVVSAKNDGIRGTDNDLRLTFTGRANNVPSVEMTVTDRGMREGMTPAIAEAATEMKGLINGTATLKVDEARTFDIVRQSVPANASMA